jgi:hypothetical protein
MFTKEELKNNLLSAISSHQSLDHKLHLMEAVEGIFNEIEELEGQLKEWIDMYNQHIKKR